jgi:hypothetical protein
VPTLATASEGAIFANAVLEEANRLRQEQSETVKAIRDDIKAEFRAIREDAKAAQESTQAEFRAIREDVTNLNTTIKVIAASGGTVAVVVGLLANAGKILRLF